MLLGCGLGDAENWHADLGVLNGGLLELCVVALQTEKYVASVSRKQLRPSVAELYGRGSIIKMANQEHCDLNIRGKQAFDHRVREPSGDHWDCSKGEDRREVKEAILRDEPDWLIGSPPCTPFSSLTD